MGSSTETSKPLAFYPGVIFIPTPIPGVMLVEPERVADDRGHFARTFCAREFAARGLDPTVIQCSASYNARAGTLRGMHYQAQPHAEAKLVHCARGAIHDVALDLRPESPAHGTSYGVELTEENGCALFIPAGCAHGFQTLDEDTVVLYQISVAYEPGAGRGVRWDDPAFAIAWPDPPTGGRTISARDASYPDYVP